MANLNHESIFTQSYSRLRSWAVQIAGQDHSLAEDLLHDAFIQFTRTQPKLEDIQNLDGYLYGMIRNLYNSYVRKTTRRNTQQLSIIDFDTFRLGLRNLDAYDNLQTQDELRRISHYLCLRKETTRAASVMILRFFHGYYPSEIAEVLRTTPQAVKVRLRVARVEAKTALENPEIIKLIADKSPPELALNGSFRSSEDLANNPGEMIFRSRAGHCREDLESLYRRNAPTAEPVDTKTLAHIVSCRTCLDKVNSLLGLLPVAERYSVDFIGKNNGNHDRKAEEVWTIQ